MENDADGEQHQGEPPLERRQSHEGQEHGQEHPHVEQEPDDPGLHGHREEGVVRHLRGGAEQRGADPAARQLDRELERLNAHLRDTVAQYEASTEELKASNEELQAMNEELRSATEELETGREELQSINEELTTVNQELKSKVDELGHSNSDMRNLMNATAIATVFLDRELRITRPSPTIKRARSYAVTACSDTGTAHPAIKPNVITARTAINCARCMNPPDCILMRPVN